MFATGPPHSTFTGPVIDVSSPRSPWFAGCVTSRIVRSVTLLSVTVKYACARFTGVSVTDSTGGLAPTPTAALFAVCAAATTVAELAGAFAGTSPSQFSIFISPPMLPPPGSRAVSAVNSSSVGVTFSCAPRFTSWACTFSSL